METEKTTFNKQCSEDNHRFEWRDWSTSTYLYGYWVCKICGALKFNWRKWEENKGR